MQELMGWDSSMGEFTVRIAMPPPPQDCISSLLSKPWQLCPYLCTLARCTDEIANHAGNA